MTHREHHDFQGPYDTPLRSHLHIFRCKDNMINIKPSIIIDYKPMEGVPESQKIGVRLLPENTRKYEF